MDGVSPSRGLLFTTFSHARGTGWAPFTEVIAILIIHGREGGKKRSGETRVHFEWERKLPNLAWLLAIRRI